MAILRLYTGADGKSHFEEIDLVFEPCDDRSEYAVVHAASGIVMRRFHPQRPNPWHNAPGRTTFSLPKTSRVRAISPVRWATNPGYRSLSHCHRERG